MEKKVFIPIIVILIAVIFFTGISIDKKTTSFYLAFARDYLKSGAQKENAVLKMENEKLKAQIEQLSAFYLNNGDFLSVRKEGEIIAGVFSSYPFNFKNILVIDKGLVDGVEKGAIVFWQDNVLLGKADEVSENYSNIKTFFDPGVQIPVKIGEEKINGLFKGGGEPKIELIEKPVKIGDAIFAFSSDFPIGMKIGEIKEIKKITGAVFSEATVKFPYRINEIETVILAK